MNDLISTLPHVNAVLNTTSALCLIAGYILIRRRRTNAHRALMIAAFFASIIFLISYLTYHSLRAYYLGFGPKKFEQAAGALVRTPEAIRQRPQHYVADG